MLMLRLVQAGVNAFLFLGITSRLDPAGFKRGVGASG